ncbi:hypothetical protein F5883DRAFT_203772 [Diaporthe sp. PMI_573]|nr:hypothetical protein F5883DRAFT_203772 [Diaporthaceae sp. PMI_573]
MYCGKRIPQTAPIPVSIIANASRGAASSAWGRAECERRIRRACFFVTYRAWQEFPRHIKGTTAIVAAAWPTLNRCCSMGKARSRSRGPSLRGAATFVPFIFICCCFLFLFVISTSYPHARCTRLIHRPCAVQHEVRRSTVRRSEKALAPGGKRKKHHTPEQRGCIVTSIVSK